MDMADKAVLYSCLCFFREFGEVGAAKPDVVRLSEEASAASRRLCVETTAPTKLGSNTPSAASRRLCVETWQLDRTAQYRRSAASRRLCVETVSSKPIYCLNFQPPLGGCVLKRSIFNWISVFFYSAASRRLCVETAQHHKIQFVQIQPPLGGCVLKHSRAVTCFQDMNQPPLGGCVLKRRQKRSWC